MIKTDKGFFVITEFGGVHSVYIENTGGHHASLLVKKTDLIKELEGALKALKGEDNKK